MRQKSGKEYNAWIKGAKHAFQDFVHNLELKRRREEGNLEQRSYHDALSQTAAAHPRSRAAGYSRE